MLFNLLPKNKLLFSISQILFLLSVIIISFSLFGIKASAADFRSQDVLEINSNVDENAYYSGGEINIRAPVQGELSAIGGRINIQSPVADDIFLTGGEIKIDAYIDGNISAVGGQVDINVPGDFVLPDTLRVVGGDVSLSGKFGDDVLIIGGNVNLKDAEVEGDLIVSGGNLSLENSQIFGNLRGSLGDYDSQSIEKQVEGEVEIIREGLDSDQAVPLVAGMSAVSFFGIAFGVIIGILSELAVLLGLIILIYILDKKKKLEDETIKTDSEFLKDILLGLLFTIGTVLAVTFSFFLFVFPFFLVIKLSIIIFVLFSLSGIYFPIYVANFIKNSSDFKIDFKVLIFIVYFGFLIFGLIPVLNILTGLIAFIFTIANFGYIMKRLIQLIDIGLNYQPNRSPEEKTEKDQKVQEIKPIDTDKKKKKEVKKVD